MGDGTTDDLKGRVKDAVGGLTGDNSLQAEGKMDKMKGKMQDKLGDTQRRLDRELTDAEAMDATINDDADRI